MTMANVTPWAAPGPFQSKSLEQQWREAADRANAARPSQGLSEAQVERLAALERSTRITALQAGEARALMQRATPEQRERALKVWQRGEAGQQVSQMQKKMIERMK
jgi:hypothetical protein